jgi:hypothetical protein
MPARAPAAPTDRRWPWAVVAAWALAQALALLRPVVPLPPPWSGTLPWNMFSEPRPDVVTLRAEGRTPAGDWVEIPLDRWYRYARGATGQRLCDTSRYLREPGHDGERRAFAAWLAARMADDGAPVRAVRLVRRTRTLADGRVRERRILHWTADEHAPR